MLNEGVYVSCSSAEIERARKWMNALRARGIKVTSTWIEVIEKSGGVANPRDATIDQRQQWAITDCKEVINSSVMWLLMPVGPHSFGATFEYTFFEALCDKTTQTSIVSGDYKRSIFTSFSPCFDTDEEAFEAIIKLIENRAPDCTCDGKPEQVPGAPDGLMLTPHTPECAISKHAFGAPEGCVVSPVSSAACDRGTRGCDVKHPENENAAQPEG